MTLPLRIRAPVEPEAQPATVSADPVRPRRAGRRIRRFLLGLLITILALAVIAALVGRQL
ncbi:MAG: hypothetical protein QM607_08790 [Microbacterium sp.]